MSTRQKMDAAANLIEGWTLPSAATLGSSVRARGIVREVRAHLPLAAKKLLGIEVGALRMPEGAYGDFRTASAIVSKTLEGIEGLPVIPREVEDILTISSAERHRWLKDGRLQSTGTRTVKLRGRARKVTFHVFDPRHIDVLDRDLVTVWREDDAIAAAENRRRAAGKAALKRAQKSGRRAASAPDSTRDEVSRQKLKGWDEFESDGLLR
ncbi:MAG: hypothetical protein EOR30_15255 [Mesorhizobium sp.]|uniref:hypothetical protein n=2 Tax=Mesorhizobium sp. TaxID=1871066 RepID=UPI000FE2D880|nr:hypothetical protein [Mesorhizobium sp.]RWF93857.1 MAG: hypothetical protein EOQ45_15385 [Mesorhizobium sp.]RWI40519.1 MAG: hypothetical protein EOR14_15285 [Mesorhizobium sp.]RWI65113.1 MAG: hypothetical protein EOR17_23735 [Mesorhizobium sp.]RWI84367.1 MAG: hypothetical protein EOR20_16510 [Mesorhizobium sp.]RWJ52914.1 MAG: hypothetical protein EOR30_15255 [Mesorhizobium sp.]